MDTEKADHLAYDLQLRSMFDGYRVWQIEEIDRVTKDAQVRLLTVLDDLPPQTAVIGTSNCEVKDFEERFQRRFKVAELTAPKSEDIHALLVRLGTPDTGARRISFGCGGNVGQALEDADLYCLDKAA